MKRQEIPKLGLDAAAFLGAITSGEEVDEGETKHRRCDPLSVWGAGSSSSRNKRKRDTWIDLMKILRPFEI